MLQEKDQAGKNITIDPKNKDEYFLKIDNFLNTRLNLSQNELKSRQDMAKKFMYLYLIKIPKLFPFPSGGFWSQKSENLLNDLISKDSSKYTDTFKKIALVDSKTRGFI